MSGAGDRRFRVLTRNTIEDENPGYRKRRLANGLPLPVFGGEDVDQESAQFHSFHNLQGTRGESHFGNEGQFLPDLHGSNVSIATEYLSCPICSDPCIESTSINCGHKFCKDCIEEWRKQKPICPICSTLITSSHRLYSDDLLIESLLNSLSPEVRQRFKIAQDKRLETLKKEKESRNMVKRVREKLNKSLTFIRCKNVASLEDKLTSASHHLQSKMYMWVTERNFGILVGIILVGIFIVLANNFTAFCNFMQYLWLAIKKYDGVIPDQWISRKSIVSKNQPALSMSSFESLIVSLNRVFR